jgi:hypothetical protein
MVVVLLVTAVTTIRYPRRYLTTRRQLTLLNLVSVLIVLPLLVSRITTEPVVVAMALSGLALVPAALSYRGLRFLARQEQLHAQPTPDMTFVFTVLATYPLAMSVFLLILLAER